MIASTNRDYKRNIIPYGMVFTKFFRYFNAPFSNEKSSIKISKFSSKNLSHVKKYLSIPLILNFHQNQTPLSLGSNKRKLFEKKIVLNPNSQKFGINIPQECSPFQQNNLHFSVAHSDSTHLGFIPTFGILTPHSLPNPIM